MTYEETEYEQSPNKIVLVGMDVGFHSTVIQTGTHLSELLLPETIRLPTWVSYPEHGESVEVGQSALDCRDTTRPINPLANPKGAPLRDFANALRSYLDPGEDHELWGVINTPIGATPKEIEPIRLIAHQVFDRTRVLDDALLMATAFGCRDVASKSLWIDVGATSTRVVAIQGGSPGPIEESSVIPGGGHAVRDRLSKALRGRFPGFALTDISADGVKEHLAHVFPVMQSCPLRIVFEGKSTVVNVESPVNRACEPLVDEILQGVRSVVSGCPSDEIEEFLERIVLSGGGSRMRGLADRVQQDLRREFDDFVTVRVPQEPATLAANGALRWAHFTEEDAWEISLFSFA